MVKNKMIPLIALVAILVILGLFLFPGGERYGKSGWADLEDGRGYLDVYGKPLTGWQEIDGITCYFDENGILCTGWTEIDGIRCYLDPDGSLATGWRMIDEKRCYLTDRGTLATGWVEIHDQMCYFSPDGSPASGWTEIDGKQYLLNPNGVPATGWQELDGKRYYLGEDGAMCTGWTEYAGCTYYFDETGVMAVGEIRIDGEKYHFTPDGIYIPLVNPWNDLPVGFAPELIMVEDPFRVNAVCYESLMWMLSDCAAAGHDPLLASAYRTMADQEYLYDRKVQFYLDEGYDEEDARRLAATVVAVPGTSEHQLGLAVDIVDGDFRDMTDEQANTATQRWLMEHCWEYGFILRYPKGTTAVTGIIYEPWHYRYVGVEVAMAIRDSGMTLEEYLGATQTE